MGMDAADARLGPMEAGLVVVADGTTALEPWLDGATRSLVELVEWSRATPLALDRLPSSIPQPPPPESHTPHRRFVELPLDGPPRALRLALRAIRDQQQGSGPCPVIVKYEDGTPPEPAVVLDIAAAGLLPAVDVRAFQWVADDEAWVTTAAGLTKVPHFGRQSNGRRDLARLIIGLGLGASARSRAHLDLVAHQPGFAGTDAEWQVMLSALYVDNCVRCLQRRPSPAP